MRLFVTEDLTVGFAIKGDDMIRAFNDPKSDYSSIATAFILVANIKLHWPMQDGNAL
jgi:hypothetical protein